MLHYTVFIELYHEWFFLGGGGPVKNHLFILASSTLVVVVMDLDYHITLQCKKSSIRCCGCGLPHNSTVQVV